MLSSISWQHYCAAVFILSLAYYVFITLRYYRNELAAIFNANPSSSNFVPPVNASPFIVMGAAKPDNGTSIVGEQELVFSEPEPDELINSHRDVVAGLNQGTAIDQTIGLIAEAGSLISAFKDIDHKAEFLDLLRLLVGSYKRFGDEIDLPAAIDKIVASANDKLLFSIESGDISNLPA